MNNRIARVAHITTVNLSLRYLLINQLLFLNDQGFEVVGMSSYGNEIPYIRSRGIEHISVTMSRNLTPLTDIESLQDMFNTIRREQFTIVHTHNPKPGLLGQLAARMAGVPIVINTLHGFYFHDHMHPLWRRFYITMEKIAALCSDVILSQNHEDIETAIKEGICPPHKIKYLGNGIDLAVFSRDRFCSSDISKKQEQFDIPDDAKVIGFVGRLAARRKGFLDFFKACELVAEHIPNVFCLIAGDADLGKPDSVDIDTFRTSQIWPRCRFLGQRPNSELPLLYSLMDVLSLPSLFEGLPRALMEASAMGIPIVATDVKGNREAVEHGENGFLVPLGNVQALADAICDILSDPDKARRMGEAGRRIAMERFDEQIVFEKVKAEYARLLTEKGLPTPTPRNEMEESCTAEPANASST